MIDKNVIEKLARLARLQISDEEAVQFSQQLDKALSHFQKISELDTEGVEPLVTPVEIELKLRDDQVQQVFTAEQITSNAPEKVGNLFKVPPVV